MVRLDFAIEVVDIGIADSDLFLVDVDVLTSTLGDVLCPGSPPQLYGVVRTVVLKL